MPMIGTPRSLAVFRWSPAKIPQPARINGKSLAQAELHTEVSNAPKPCCGMRLAEPSPDHQDTAGAAPSIGADRLERIDHVPPLQAAILGHFEE